MTEENKIETLLRQYNPFFEATTADITVSIKGRRFFFFTDSESGLLYSIAEFTTAEELEQILLHEMANELNMAIENSIEEINEHINYKNISFTTCAFGTAIKHLADTVEVIHKEFSRYSTFQSSLLGLSTYMNKCREDKKQ